MAFTALGAGEEEELLRVPAGQGGLSVYRMVVAVTLSMPGPAAGPVPARIALRMRSGSSAAMTWSFDVGDGPEGEVRLRPLSVCPTATP